MMAAQRETTRAPTDDLVPDIPASRSARRIASGPLSIQDSAGRAPEVSDGL
jgi:hypothetical protein